MNTLIELAKLSGTDKLEHGYLPYYEKHLPKNPLYLLEIGVFKGASLVLWDSYYNNKVNIHAMDLFAHPENVTERWCLENNFVPFKGSQSDYKDLNKLPINNYDVIIEDASHNSSDQIITLSHCFFHNLKSGGLYVVEDLHCCNNVYYWGNGVESFNETLLYFFKNIENKDYINSIESTSLLGKIKTIMHLFGDVNLYDDKICFITKK